MAVQDLPRLDFQMISKTGHWCPLSQKYASAHNVLWALDHGWQIDPKVICIQYPRRAGCTVSVYRFTLYRDHSTLVMPVINTPYLLRLIAEHDLHVVSTTAQDRRHKARV